MSRVDIGEIINKTTFQSAQRTQSAKDQNFQPKVQADQTTARVAKLAKLDLLSACKRPTGAIPKLTRQIWEAGGQMRNVPSFSEKSPFSSARPFDINAFWEWASAQPTQKNEIKKVARKSSDIIIFLSAFYAHQRRAHPWADAFFKLGRNYTHITKNIITVLISAVRTFQLKKLAAPTRWKFSLADIAHLFYPNSVHRNGIFAVTSNSQRCQDERHRTVQTHYKIWQRHSFRICIDNTQNYPHRSTNFREALRHWLKQLYLLSCDAGRSMCVRTMTMVANLPAPGLGRKITPHCVKSC